MTPLTLCTLGKNRKLPQVSDSKIISKLIVESSRTGELALKATLYMDVLRLRSTLLKQPIADAEHGGRVDRGAADERVRVRALHQRALPRSRLRDPRRVRAVRRRRRHAHEGQQAWAHTHTHKHTTTTQ